jgi:hypothetical protein
MLCVESLEPVDQLKNIRSASALYPSREVEMSQWLRCLVSVKIVETFCAVGSRVDSKECDVLVSPSNF